MASAFDSMFLPGGDLASHEDFLNLDTTNFQLSNDHIHDDGTVSPQDLFRDDSMIMSAPPSAAFPNLSTPESGYLESPHMPSSGLNTSPLDDGLLDATLNMSELDGLPPLFPQDSCGQFAYMPADSLPQNNSFSSINSRPSSNASPMVRQKSSPGRPPTVALHNRKHSLNSGINKPSKPRKNLPEIQIESDDDKETAKRKKNTAAARKSRMRKQENQEALEAEINRLRNIVFTLGGNPDIE